jgi:hypothetical protein
MLLCPQASDYAVILKLNDWEKLHAATYKMMLLLASLKQGEYVRSLVAHLNILCCLESDDTSIWRMYSLDPACFNEVAGEDSFGVLARCVLGDTQKSKFKHVSDMYSLIHLYRQVNADTKDDIAGPLQEKKFTTGTFMVKEDSTEVVELAAFFRTTIREIMSNSFRIYDGSVLARTSKAKAQERMMRDEAPKQMLDLQASEAFVLAQLEKVKKTVSGQFWLGQFRHVWPEANIVPEANANDERLGAGGPLNTDSDSEATMDLDQVDVEPWSDENGEPIIPDEVLVDRPRNKVGKAAGKQKKPKSKKRRKRAVTAISTDDERDDEPLSLVRAALIKEGNEGEGEEDGDNDVDWKEGDIGIPDHIIGERVHHGVAQFLILWDDGLLEGASWEDKDYYVKWPEYAKLLEDWAEAKPAREADQAKKSAQRKSSNKAFKGGKY